MNYSFAYPKKLLLIVATLLACSFSFNSHGLQLSFASPPTIEEASFILINKNATEDNRIQIDINNNCSDCPNPLFLTTSSSIQVASSKEIIPLADLKIGQWYESIYISYDPNTKSVFSVLLR